MKVALFAAALALATPFATSAANAGQPPATAVYTISGTGTGSLGGTSFTDRAFTFTLTGDTADLGYNELNPLTRAVVSISGLGTATFTISTRIGVNGGPDNDVGYFGRTGLDGGSSLDLFDFHMASPIDLSSSFGPLTGSDVFALEDFVNVGTNRGPLTFSSSSSVLFSGVVRAVPEPATWAMTLLGFGAIGASMRHRRRKTLQTA